MGKFHEEFVKQLKFRPTFCQDSLFAAVESFLNGTAFSHIIDGYAGTGKTTAVSSIIQVLKKNKIKTVLLAPTGKSAKNLASMAGKSAFTVHRFIYKKITDSTGEILRFDLSSNSYENAVFFVDEVSLIGEGTSGGTFFGSGDLLEDLVKYVKRGKNCRIIFIGDSAQLPPVNSDYGRALSEDYMVRYGETGKTVLNEVVRQDKESGILHNATIIRHKIMENTPEISISDMNLEIRGYPDILSIRADELQECLSDSYYRYGEDSTVILCLSNKRTNLYNNLVRSRMKEMENKLDRGDKIMIVKNNYSISDESRGVNFIANGDVAVVEKVYSIYDYCGYEYALADIFFPDYDMSMKTNLCLESLNSEKPSMEYSSQSSYKEKVLNYLDENPESRSDKFMEDPLRHSLDIKYSYAMTGHKAQGGQWKCVFVDNPIWENKISINKLKWLYTAVTRGIEKVYLVNFNNTYFI